MAIVKQPYSILTDSTLSTYKHVINDILDKSIEVTGYKDNRGIPGRISNKDIASEIYSYFLTHYFKAIDLYNYESEICVEWIDNCQLNIIDIGANIGTVTFAFIDILQKINKAQNIKFNIIFVEPNEFRCKLLDKAMNKYIQLSNLHIEYHIINEVYENSIDQIERKIQQSNTVILMSNILNWINDLIWESFRDTLIRNVNAINSGYGCRVINIEATSPTNSQEKIEKLYKESLIDEVAKFYDNKIMSQFKNIKECYFYNSNRETYRTSKKYYYGFLMKYRHYEESIDIGYIDVAYNKTLYTCRNSSIYDNLEMKYINFNFSNIKKYIYELINTGRRSSSYNYEYYIKKSNDGTRPLYVDDFINDIIATTVIISEGLETDKKQNDNISYGNRVDKNMNSPYVYTPYYMQFFNKLKEKEKEYSRDYNYYYKIDLSKYYNNIPHEKLKELLNNHEGLKKEWCNKQINLFINKQLSAYESNMGLAQGPDLSHLLANIYLKEFDDWFSSNFADVKLLRYVDDMEIIGKNKNECEEVLEKCEDYLENYLRLKINKTKDKSGNIEELFIDNKDIFFEKVIFLSNYILKSLYKLDEKNYKKFTTQPLEFLSIYQKCLNKLGIHLSKEWLNLKIGNEVNFLARLKKKFKNNKELVRWIEEKKIYDIRLQLGKIPDIESEKLIESWFNEFSSQNKEFVEQLTLLKTMLSEKLKDIINLVKLEESNATENKSIFKFLINKMHIFKCIDFRVIIKDIETYFPYYNKKVLSSYNECYQYVKNQLIDEEIKYTSYDYALNIWLLGEYGNEDSLLMLQDIYIESHKANQAFINTLATESILKIGKVNDNFINILKNQLSQYHDYYYIRNALLILNITNDIEDILEDLEKRSFKEQRVNIFIEWIKNNRGYNILDRIENIRKEYKENYPTYPIDIITYISS